MTRTSTRRSGASRGFTLVEMLIALVLLALLMVVLTAALRSMGQVEDRIEQRVQASDDYWLATQLLDDVLGQVSARRFASQQAGAPAQVPFFEAGPDSLSWIGVMPARYGLGGRHYLHLAVEDGALVLRYAPWNGAPTFSDWGAASAQVLAAPVSALALQYQEPASGQWSPAWPPAGIDLRDLPPDLLPSAVALQIDGPVPAWPPLAIATVATAASSGIGAIRGAWGGGG